MTWTWDENKKSILCVFVNKYNAFARTLRSRCNQTYTACVGQSLAPATFRASIHAVRFIITACCIVSAIKASSSAEPCACMWPKCGCRALRLLLHLAVMAGVLFQLLILLRDNEFMGQSAFLSACLCMVLLLRILCSSPIWCRSTLVNTGQWLQKLEKRPPVIEGDAEAGVPTMYPCKERCKTFGFLTCKCRALRLQFVTVSFHAPYSQAAAGGAQGHFTVD